MSMMCMSGLVTIKEYWLVSKPICCACAKKISRVSVEQSTRKFLISVFHIFFKTALKEEYLVNNKAQILLSKT